MCNFKKRKTDGWNPMFPIYIDTKKVKDNLAIKCDGITTMYSVSEDFGNHSEKGLGISVESGIYKTTLKNDLANKKTNSKNHSEKYERIHTDASLLYKLLEELKKGNKIKSIKGIDDINKTKEGDIVLLEGKISGTENILWINKLIAFTNIFSGLDKTGNLKEVSNQLNDIKEALINNNAMSNAINMVCSLEDESEVLLFMDMSYLIGDTGVELKHGKFKVLGVVYEKIGESEEFDLTRDSMFSAFSEKITEPIIQSVSNNDKVKEVFEFPVQKNKIQGPSLGILPIGIYL